MYNKTSKKIKSFIKQHNKHTNKKNNIIFPKTNLFCISKRREPLVRIEQHDSKLYKCVSIKSDRTRCSGVVTHICKDLNYVNFDDEKYDNNKVMVPLCWKHSLLVYHRKNKEVVLFDK